MFLNRTHGRARSAALTRCQKKGLNRHGTGVPGLLQNRGGIARVFPYIAVIEPRNHSLYVARSVIFKCRGKNALFLDLAKWGCYTAGNQEGP